MKPIAILAFALVPMLAAGAGAQSAAPETPAAETAPETAAETPTETATETLTPLDAHGHTLEEFLWVARPLVVFADTPADPRFQRQMELLSKRPRDLAERDVVVIVDTDPRNRSDIRRALRPRGFSFVLVDKDGTVTLRKPEPWHVREIIRTIDKTPLRQQEMRERRAAEAAATRVGE